MEKLVHDGIDSGFEVTPKRTTVASDGNSQWLYVVGSIVHSGNKRRKKRIAGLLKFHYISDG
jgi:hypothetical protein